MSKLDIMVDLETLSTKNNAVIIQLSAVVFDAITGKTYEEFNHLINPASGIKKGLKVDGSTMEWWLTQDKEVVKNVIQKAITKGEELDVVLNKFALFYEETCKSHKCKHMNLWGNGPSADCVWIDSAYAACSISNPFKYWDERCVRTIVDLGKRLLNIDPKKTMEFKGNAHNAIDDCKHQILYVTEIFKKLNK